jgi:uncharacterized Zn finger protein
VTKKKPKTFLDLTWSDLEDWAGSRILSRGASYNKSGLVQELTLSDGSLLAWVRGSRRYATTVSLTRGKLASDCTCPYGGTCKHAVAVVLDYLDRVKRKEKVPLAGADDERLLLLGNGAALGDEDDDCIDFTGEDYEDDDEEDDIDASLNKKSKREIQAMLRGILKTHPTLKDELKLKPVAPKKRGCETLTRSVLKAILEASSEPGWSSHWRHEGFMPDYGQVRDGLQRMLDEGCADDVVRLGDKLLDKGTEQVEQSDDEGDTAMEVSRAMAFVFKALAVSTMPDADKLERAINFGMRDEYGLCEGFEQFMKRRFAKRAWSEVADRLLARLKDQQPSKTDDAFSRDYRRDRLASTVIDSLERAGKTDEAVAVCFQEAEATKSYERLVKKLRELKRFDDAEEWIRKGVKETREKLPGIASSLQKELSAIRREKRDWPFVAALCADSFLEDPSLQTYKELRSASEKAKVWKEIRPACLGFLETGVSPRNKQGWPLPETGLAGTVSRRGGKPPQADVLMDIAIEEKRIDDVLHWHGAQKRSGSGWYGFERDDRVASAVVRQYPDKAVAIWKEIAERFIAQTKVNAYASAVAYLKKARKALDELGRTAEWSGYLMKLIETNRKKPRLVQMLNVLSAKRIIE